MKRISDFIQLCQEAQRTLDRRYNQEERAISQSNWVQQVSLDIANHGGVISAEDYNETKDGLSAFIQEQIREKYQQGYQLKCELLEHLRQQFANRVFINETVMAEKIKSTVRDFCQQKQQENPSRTALLNDIMDRYCEVADKFSLENSSRQSPRRG